MPRGRKEIGVFNSIRTPEERREIAVKAGKASAVARAKMRTVKEKWELLAASKPPREVMKTLKTKMGVKPDNWDDAMMLACMAEAMRGNIKAIELIYKMRGELTENVNLNVNPFEALLKSLPDEEEE